MVPGIEEVDTVGLDIGGQHTVGEGTVVGVGTVGVGNMGVGIEEGTLVGMLVGMQEDKQVGSKVFGDPHLQTVLHQVPHLVHL